MSREVQNGSHLFEGETVFQVVKDDNHRYVRAAEPCPPLTSPGTLSTAAHRDQSSAIAKPLY